MAILRSRTVVGDHAVENVIPNHDIIWYATQPYRDFMIKHQVKRYLITVTVEPDYNQFATAVLVTAEVPEEVATLWTLKNGNQKT